MLGACHGHRDMAIAHRYVMLCPINRGEDIAELTHCIKIQRHNAAACGGRLDDCQALGKVALRGRTMASGDAEPER